eukprot:Skav229525  [mRNA]  locus=scaffold887:151561:154017:+ [translate_table: standard]
MHSAGCCSSSEWRSRQTCQCLAMTHADILEAFRRYCHADVVNEFQQLRPENQQAWLNAFVSTCRRQVTSRWEDRFAEAAMRLPGAEPDSILAQMLSHASTSRTETRNPCPLLCALKPQIKLDLSLWADLLEPVRRDFLPTWGKTHSRKELEDRHQMGLIHNQSLQRMLSQNSALASMPHSDATVQKPMATTKPWSSLEPIAFAELPIFMVAEGKVAHCKVILDPFVKTAVQLLVEDDLGQVMPLQLYNQLPESSFGDASAKEVLSKFAKGTKLSIAEPFLKIMNDGYRGIRVDVPSDVAASLDISGSDLQSLKKAGNSAFSQEQFDLAREHYMAALQLPEIDEVVKFLANRAQVFLDIDPIEACKDAAATLLLRPGHKKAGLRYAAALMKSAKQLADDGNSAEFVETMLHVAKRAATLYPGATNEQGEQAVTQGDVRNVLRIFLSGFEDGIKFYQNRLDLDAFGVTAAQCREEANLYYKAGDRLKAISGCTIGLGKACAKTVAIILSNLSEVFLKLRESHNAIAFALAALRFGAAELSEKLLSRTCRALAQVGEDPLAFQLGKGVAEAAEVQKKFRTRVYENGMAEVLVDCPVTKANAVLEFVHPRIKTVELPGKGRGVLAAESMEAGELLVVNYALSLALAAENDFSRITSGRVVWHASKAKLISRFAYCASSNNEVTWQLSQLCEKPGESKDVIQPHDLVGLSHRWMPLLGQQHCYYPQSDRVFLAKTAIDSIIMLNAHGSQKTDETRHTGIFPSACFFNHSPDSNCAYVPVKLGNGPEIPEILAVMTIKAVTEGEELSVCYAENMPTDNVWGITA